MKMKQTNVVFLVLVIMILNLNAQVGINTFEPIGVLHIDSKGDTDISANKGDTDDVVILSDGRVGIGTTSPQSSLDVQGSLRIADGTQNANLVLTTNDEGYAHWDNAPNMSVLEGNIDENGLANIQVGGNEVFRYSGASISLPAGNWMVYYYAIYNNKPNSNSTLWWDLTDSPTVYNYIRHRVLSYTTVGATLAVTYASYSVVNSIPQTYYVWGVCLNSTSPDEFTYKEGGRIWATPIY